MFNTNITNHLDQVTFSTRAIFEKAALRIEAIKPGETVPATKLADAIAKELDMTGAQLYSTLKFLFNNYPGVMIKHGRNGGVYRLLPGENMTDKKATSTEVDSDLP